MSKSDSCVVDVKDVAAKNKKVNLGKVQEVTQAVNELRKLGVAGRCFTLAPPFQRQMDTKTRNQRM